jgi:hypothetical protein
MRYLRCFCLAMLIAATLQVTLVQAQIFHARAVGHYRRGSMFMLDRMADPAQVSGCSRLVLVGSVVSIEYDNKKQIVSFSQQVRNGRVLKLVLPDLLYEPQLPVEAEIGLGRLVDKSKRLRVVAYDCRGSLEVDQIKAL